jgi:hypothetical protein
MGEGIHRLFTGNQTPKAAGTRRYQATDNGLSSAVRPSAASCPYVENDIPAQGSGGAQAPSLSLLAPFKKNRDTPNHKPDSRAATGHSSRIPLQYAVSFSYPNTELILPSECLDVRTPSFTEALLNK